MWGKLSTISTIVYALGLLWVTIFLCAHATHVIGIILFTACALGQLGLWILLLAKMNEVLDCPVLYSHPFIAMIAYALGLFILFASLRFLGLLGVLSMAWLLLFDFFSFPSFPK